MTPQPENPVIAFVWRPKEITSSVVEVARQTKTRAIFDLSSIQAESAGLTLVQADATGDAVDLKISPESLLRTGLEDFLNEAEIARVWVELHPLLVDAAMDQYLDKMAQLSQTFTAIPIVGSLDLILHILTSYPRIKYLALKGSEAAGFVCSENSFALYGAVREKLNAHAAGPGLIIWGGVATPEAAAAFLAAGAKGIVCESLHWLTDLVAIDARARDRVATIRPDHTDLIGLNLGVPCRLFNKGNSKAVRELKDYSGSLCGSEVEEEQRRALAARIRRDAIEPLDSQFGREELIPLGVEAAFADCFVRRFGSGTEQAIEGFLAAIEKCCADSLKKCEVFTNSPVAQRMGTRYPFVQGAMSWITDVPEFALKVAQAGGLPTIALGLMDEATLEARLGRLPAVMGDAPFAVNVITLAENPYRDVQLSWIRRIRPRLAVIAAGEPSHAADLLSEGIDVAYIAPNEELLKLAFEAGVKIAICEGNEAGGHVGEHSTLTLAQIVLDLKDREPGLMEGCSIVLAGGIFNRETAFMAAMLGADAIQMGTAYLATEEIVETGALTELYQRMVVSSEPGGTTLTGEATGLRVRSLRTPKIEAVCELERDFASGSEGEASFRRKIEALSAGSLFTAARGMDEPGGNLLDESECVAEGQFMSGACAGALSAVRGVERLHRELAEGKFAEGLPFLGPIREVLPPRPTGIKIYERGITSRGPERASGYGLPEAERIAVTGISVVNALGNSPEEVWAASVAKKSGIITVPASRWNHELFYHPRPRMPEKTYCKVAAFQNLEVSRKELGIPPQDFRTMTSATRLTMWLAKHAIEGSGILESDVPRERVAVLISQNSGEAAATLEDVIVRGCATNIAASVGKALHLSPEAQRIVEDEVKSGRIVIDDTTLLGRLNCSAGGFICNKYGFMGPSFSVSAACATALVAMYSAYQMIRNGVIDAAVVGGAEELLTPMHFLEFSALGALAGLSGVERPPEEYSRPFDADRDGMVLGEGGGMIVIERESIARKRNARVHAYITSMGASNNNLGMVESSSSTQEIAIRASFRDAPYGPEHVHLVECHATGTRQGDVEEVRALQTFFGSNGRTKLVSFKSQIGHTLGASGVNSLIRGIMAMRAGVFPPNLNYTSPDPEVAIEGSALEVHTEPTEWNSGDGKPRRLQVNAFGFGGSNYVVQLEQALEDADTILVPAVDPDDKPRGEPCGRKLPDGIFCFETRVGSNPYRIGVLTDSEQEARKALDENEVFQNGGPIPAKRRRALARQGIHVGPTNESPPALAFVFPGQGSHYAGMGHELYQSFPVIKEWMDRAADVADFDLLNLLFHDREEDLQKTRWQQPALFTMEYAMVQYLWSLGVRPAALAGHSLGELTALCLAGVYSFEDGFRIVNKRAVCMDKACQMNVDPGVMMACDAPLEVLEKMMERLEQVYVTNINSPRQVVIGGNTEAVEAMGAELKEQGYRTTLLRVSMAFHSPIMVCIRDELQEFIRDIEFHPPKIPVISNTTRKPFAKNTEEIKRTVMAHLESPVHWMQNVRTLVDDFGVKLFVEVGPREILSNLISDTVEDVDCIQTCLPSAEVMIYKTALAQLFSRGHLEGVKASGFAVTAEKSGNPPVVAPVGAAEDLRPTPSRRVPSTLDQIVQREINSFVMETFGRFLSPHILAAIRREYDPNYTEESLERILKEMFPDVTFPAIPPPVPMAGQVAVTPEATAPPQEQLDDRAEREAASGKTDTVDVTETVIRIIMDATGYDRDEIEPDMDLREDLSIRSSRLPVIMDSLEGHFNMKIELEDFIDVRTIKDIANRISEVLARGGAAPALPDREPAFVQPEDAPPTKMVEDRQSIKRIVFSEIPLEAGSVQPVELSPLDAVAILSAEGGTGLRTKVGGVFRRDYGATIVPLAFLEAGEKEDGSTFDLRTEEGISLVRSTLGRLESPAGLVFIIDDVLENKLNNMKDVSAVLKGMFSSIQAFVESPSRKFVLLIHKTDDDFGTGRILAEGGLGILLSAAHEFSSVLFRMLRLDSDTDINEAIRAALDRSRKPVKLTCRGSDVSQLAGHARPCTLKDSQGLELDADDVIVFSGGAYGITPHLARSLVPLGCKMVFFGRTCIDTDMDLERLLSSEDEGEQAVAALIAESKPHLSGSEREEEIARVLTSLEIVRTLEDLRSRGIDAEYVTCDVTDARGTRTAIKEIVDRYGRIDGFVHAAGFLRDSFVKQMSLEDFQAVVDVKLLGAWNLFEAAREAGLRFFVSLSSAACIQGNPGQSNYASGNRAMSALMTCLHHNDPSLRCKALILPPIEGAGMAENPEIKVLMARMNASYVHVEELAALFSRELLIAPADDVWVMFMRSLPDVSTASIDPTDVSHSPDMFRGSIVAFAHEDFPMLDGVSRIDLRDGALEATRTFSQDRDLWLADHKPFGFLRHPLVSAIMALETFGEAARVLYPHLSVVGVRNAEFIEIIACPPQVGRFAQIHCEKIREDHTGVTCALTLSTREISPTGRIMDRMNANYRAEVILGSARTSPMVEFDDFPVRPDQLETRPVDNEEVLRKYAEKTDMQGRYRIIDSLDGTGPGCIRGSIIYRHTKDFSSLTTSRYQYSPYLLEALMQLVNFYILMLDSSEQRTLIPYAIGEVWFGRTCGDGERIVIEGRVRKQTKEGITWDSLGVDETGRALMVVKGLTMRWFVK